MSKPSIHFNDYVSLAVMLLMVVALVAGQADARNYAAKKVISVAPIVILDDRFDIDLNGHIGEIGDQALNIGITLVSE